jgi:hypothetical protein
MRLRYFFDPGSGICLWAADEEARAQFGYPVALEKLPLADDTMALGNQLIASFDTSLDWNDPAGESPWSEEQRAEFMRKSEQFYSKLVSELTPRFTVVNEVCA